MVTFCGWGWREKQKDILQERSSKIFRKAYRKTRVQESQFFFFLNWAVGLQLYLKRGSCVCFFPWNFQNFSEQLFSAVNRCLWFNWILGNFDHHLRFRQMPENFDHRSWFYKKYLKFRRSYETIRKPYLEHDIV